MKRILPVVALLAFSSMPAMAGAIALQVSAATNGNRFFQQVDGVGNFTTLTEFVGVFNLSETIHLSFDVESIDDRTIDYSTGYVYREVSTLFVADSMQIASGMLASGLTPSFAPNDEALYPNVSGNLSWGGYTDSDSGLGGLLFQMGISWVASLTDEWGAFHQFNYTRSYAFSNYSLVSSSNDLVVFTEELFRQLLLDPNTQLQYQENVSEMTYGCTQLTLCGANGNWIYSVSGTFDFEPIAAVPEPSVLAMMGFAGLLLGVRTRRKQTRD